MSISNAPAFNSVRPNAIQSVLSTHKSYNSSALTFGNSKDYYRSLDPKTTEHKVNEYAEAENYWRTIIRSVETARGTQLLGILRLKTQAEYRALEQALRTHLDIDIDEHRPEEREADGIDSHTLAHTTLRGNGRVVNHTYIDSRNPANAHDNFSTLAHESIHAVHLKRQSIAPVRDEALVDDIDKLEDIIDSAVITNRVPSNQAGWNQLFKNNSDLVSDLKNAYDIEDLEKVKRHLISETVAYEMSAYLGKNETEQNCELKRGAGYRACINFINEVINEKNLELQTPPRSLSPAGWKFTLDHEWRH